MDFPFGSLQLRKVKSRFDHFDWYKDVLDSMEKKGKSLKETKQNE